MSPFQAILSLAPLSPLKVHPEPLGVPTRSQRQHEELHVRRQQQRHDELTFHARQSRTAAAADGAPPFSPTSPPPHRARMPWDHLLLLLLLPPPPADMARTGSLTTLSDLDPPQTPPPASLPPPLTPF